MSREEVQISDLEPSIIGEDVTKYAIQIRGVDGSGNEGPWSTILEYESPELLPSLQSDNYVEGQSGWFLDNDGTFEVNDGFIRGTLQSANYVPGASGWALDQSGVVEFDQGVFRGALQIGTNTFRVDSNGNLSIGGSSPSNAPFRVNTNGQILAMSIDGDFIQANTITSTQIAANTIRANEIRSGTITANEIRSGTITANEIASDYIYTNTLVASQINSGTLDPVRIPNLSAAKITSGTLNANNVTISGTLSAVTLNGVSGTFAGNLTSSLTIANTIQVNRIVSSGNLELRGAVDASDEISGNVRVRGSTINLETSMLRLPVEIGSNSGSFLVLDSNNRIRRSSSSIRYKENVRPVEKINNLLSIKPVLFDYKEDLGTKNVFGAIAEDFNDLGLESLVYYLNGQPEAVFYDKIGLALIPYVKELYDKIEELERRLDGK
jgi:hypothetical protein